MQEPISSSAAPLVTSSEKLELDGQLSLTDILQFALDAWQKLAIAAIVGAAIGLGGWFFLGQYSAQYILLNNTGTYGLDLVSWKAIQKSLPHLAAQVIEADKAPPAQEGLYQAMVDDQWWQKNVVPSYALSKADIKDLGVLGKDFEAANSTILSFAVSAAGPSKLKAIDTVKEAAQFFRTGAAYLQVRSLLNAYEGELISAAADVQKKITTTQIEVGYQQQRARSLEDLYKRYPGNSSVGQQVVDAKESGAKYLSITTQIVAANSDINQSKENLQRLLDRLTGLALMNTFLNEALPLVDTTFDGLALSRELLAVEARMRSKLPKDDLKQQEFLDQIHAQLLTIVARFTKGLEAGTIPTSKKSGMLKSAAGGLVAGFFLMLCLLLGQKVYLKIKSGGI